MYSSLCHPVQSMLQKETDKCRNWRVLSNTLFWTLLISFPSLISCFYFFSYFYLWTHCFKYFTFKTCLIINKYNWKETDKVHGVCWKETDKVHGVCNKGICPVTKYHWDYMKLRTEECYSIWKSLFWTIWNKQMCIRCC